MSLLIAFFPDFFSQQPFFFLLLLQTAKTFFTRRARPNSRHRPDYMGARPVIDKRHVDCHKPPLSLT
jgi:hypothetical protein